jgi:hypothetical protein
MADDVFGETKTDTTATNPVEALVGEGKKFKTVEDLAKGKIASDEHIANLERELAGLREAAAPKFDAEKQLETLRAEIQALRADPSKGRSQEVTPPAVMEDRIAAIVQASLTRAEQNRTVTQNVMAANDAIVTAYGSLEAAAAAVNAKAAELNMSLEDLKGIAAKSPTAFQRIILGEAQKGGNEAPFRPNASAPVLKDGTPLGNAKPGTKEYFEGMMKTDRKKYWSTEVQMQLHKAVADGTYQL